ncbi:melanopsin-B-like [Paramacrobiotus metropolitanus]|uniref:melanopsin-B-like n=1 Tax=Paramacrobiotus metropolitanus TaxID=2943436 RepID=UPI0024456F9D|nr:melanopsin-B-like [Paramacrobiotus metropolitanus]
MTVSMKENASHFITIGILTIPTSIIGTMGSLLTLYLLSRLSRQNFATNALIINLCVATFLLCGTSSFYDAFTMITGQEGPSRICCVVFAFLHFLWLSVSAHSHAAIAIHRLIAVLSSDCTMCLLHTKSVATSLVIYTWLVPFLVLVFPLVPVSGEYGFSQVASRCSIMSVKSPEYTYVLKLMNSFVPLAVMTVCYLIICAVVIRSKTKFNLDDQAIRGQGARGIRLMRLKAEFRVTRIAFITCAWFIICYIPSAIHGLIATKVSEMQSAFAQFLILMTWIGCATTPIVYTLLSTEMRQVAHSEWKNLRDKINHHAHRNSIHILVDGPSKPSAVFIIGNVPPRKGHSCSGLCHKSRGGVHLSPINHALVKSNSPTTQNHNLSMA